MTRKLLLISTLFFVLSKTSYAINDAIQADRLMLKAVAAVESKDYTKAVNIFEDIEKLDAELPPSYLYYYALSLSEAGKLKPALKKLDSYLNRAGRNGDFYKEALELYNTVESELEAYTSLRRSIKKYLQEFVNIDIGRVCPNEYSVYLYEYERLSPIEQIKYENLKAVFDGSKYHLAYDYEIYQFDRDKKYNLIDSISGSDYFVVKEPLSVSVSSILSELDFKGHIDRDNDDNIKFLKMHINSENSFGTIDVSSEAKRSDHYERKEIFSEVVFHSPLTTDSPFYYSYISFGKYQSYKAFLGLCGEEEAKKIEAHFNKIRKLRSALDKDNVEQIKSWFYPYPNAEEKRLGLKAKAWEIEIYKKFFD